MRAKSQCKTKAQKTNECFVIGLLKETWLVHVRDLLPSWLRFFVTIIHSSWLHGDKTFKTLEIHSIIACKVSIKYDEKLLTIKYHLLPINLTWYWFYNVELKWEVLAGRFETPTVLYIDLKENIYLYIFSFYQSKVFGANLWLWLWQTTQSVGIYVLIMVWGPIRG